LKPETIKRVTLNKVEVPKPKADLLKKKNMKRNIKTLFITAFLITAPLFMFAQKPPLPGDTPEAGKEVGGGAPVGNGTFILLTLAVAYAARKKYLVREEKEEETE
jgi:hypothetical protein